MFQLNIKWYLKVGVGRFFISGIGYKLGNGHFDSFSLLGVEAVVSQIKHYYKWQLENIFMSVLRMIILFGNLKLA